MVGCASYDKSSACTCNTPHTYAHTPSLPSSLSSFPPLSSHRRHCWRASLYLSHERIQKSKIRARVLHPSILHASILCHSIIASCFTAKRLVTPHTHTHTHTQEKSRAQYWPVLLSTGLVSQLQERNSLYVLLVSFDVYKIRIRCVESTLRWERCPSIRETVFFTIETQEACPLPQHRGHDRDEYLRITSTTFFEKKILEEASSGL